MAEYALINSKYKDEIGKFFDYTGDFDFLDLVAEIVDNINFESEDLDEEINNAIDDKLTWTSNCWLVFEHYCNTPWEADWDMANESFFNEVYSLVNQLKNEQE